MYPRPFSHDDDREPFLPWWGKWLLVLVAVGVSALWHWWETGRW